MNNEVTDSNVLCFKMNGKRTGSVNYFERYEGYCKVNDFAKKL